MKIRKLIGFITVLALALSLFGISAFADAPVFTATGRTAGTLTVTPDTGKDLTDYGYKKPGDTDFTRITEATTTLSGLTPGDLTVSEIDSELKPVGTPTTITIGKKTAPDAGSFTVTPYTDDTHKGSISGVDENMEYYKAPDGDWQPITGTTIADLDEGTYNIRNKADGTDLASEETSVTVSAPGYGIYIGGTEITTTNRSTDPNWEYNPTTGELKLKGNCTITGSYKGSGIYVEPKGSGDTPKLTKITVTGIVSIVSDDKSDDSVSTSYGIALSDHDVTISGGGTLNAYAYQGTDDTKIPDISGGIESSGSAVTVAAGTTVNAYGGQADQFSAGFTCGELTNNGNIYAKSGASEAVIGITVTSGDIVNNPGATLKGETVSSSDTEMACAIEAYDTIENSGTIEAIATSGATYSYGIDADTVEVYGGIITSTSGDSADSTALSANLDFSTSSTDVELTSPVKAMPNAATISGTTGFKVFAGGSKPGTEVTSSTIPKTSPYLHIFTGSSSAVESIAIPTTLALQTSGTGSTGELTATVTMDPPGQYTEDGYTWVSSNPNVATVTKGTDGKATVTAVANGTANVTCSIGSVTSNVCAVTVGPVPATSLTLSDSSLTLKLNGTSATLTATLSPTGSTGTVKWSQSGGGVVSITPSADGKTCVVKPLKKGEELVYAQLGDNTATRKSCKFTVTESGTNYKITPYYGAWYYDKKDGYTFSVNTTNHIKGVSINGVTMDISGTYYGNGYQTVTIPYSSMSKLSRGYSQPLVVTFTDGDYVSGKVAVITTKDAPPTGDISLTPYAMSAVLAAAGAAGLSLKVCGRKKKR